MHLASPLTRYFDEVVKQGSIRRAADRLNVSASSINRQILQLESQLGTPLFERLPRGVALTEAGRIILAVIRRFQSESGVAFAHIEALRGLKRGHVNFGTVQYLSEYVIPNALTLLRNSFPEISYSYYLGDSKEIIDKVLDGSLDFGISWNPPVSSPIIRRATQTIPIGIVVQPTHPLAATASVRIDDLAEYPVIFPAPGTDFRSILDELNLATSTQISPTIETSSMTAIRRLAIAGAGIGFMIQSVASEELANRQLVFRPLQAAPTPSMTLCLFSRADRTLSSAAEMAISHLVRDF